MKTITFLIKALLENKTKFAVRLVLFLVCLGIVARTLVFNVNITKILPDDQFNFGFQIKEISSEAGINFTHGQEYPVDENLKKVKSWLTAQGSAVAVADVNNDGWQDIYLNTTQPFTENILYINQKNGTFKDETEKYNLLGMNKAGVTFRTIFLDCDNDGTQEMMLFSQSCPRLYKLNQTSQKFEQLSLDVNTTSCVPSVSVNVFDYNNDSYADVIYAGTTGNGFSKTDNLPMSFVSADNGANTVVLKNNGQCQYSEVKLMDRQNETLFTNAIGIGDFRNKDPWDVWFATDFNTDRMYFKKSSSDTQYSYEPEMIGKYLAKSGMSAEVNYFHSDLTPHIFVSHVYEHGYFPYGNNFWEFKDNQFKDKATAYGLQNCDWAWGARFADLANSGHPSLYVSNGFFSSPQNNNKSSYWYFLGVISAAPKTMAAKALNWKNMEGLELSGKNQDCLYVYDQKQNKYLESSKALGIDEQMLNGRGVANIDINNNGKMAYIVTNQKDRIYLYQSEPDPKNNWVGFQLKGLKTNRNGIGAKVILHYSLKDSQNDKSGFMTQVVSPYNGYASQSDNRIHFGLGENYVPKRVVIKWPNGADQQVDKIVLNKYNFIEEITE